MPDRSDIIAALNATADAWSKGDLDAFMQLYMDDQAVTYVSRDMVLQGVGAIREMYVKRFGGSARSMGRLSLAVLAYQSLGADYALVTGRYSLERSIEFGGDAGGHFTMVLRRTDLGWRIISDHAS